MFVTIFLLFRFRPVRNKYSEYYVSPEEYSPPRYPAFTLGSVYMVTRAAVHDLYTKATELAFFKLEDVFMTGIVAELLNVTRIDVDEFANFVYKEYKTCEIRKYITTFHVTRVKQFAHWKKLMGTNVKC